MNDLEHNLAAVTLRDCVRLGLADDDTQPWVAYPGTEHAHVMGIDRLPFFVRHIWAKWDGGWRP